MVEVPSVGVRELYIETHNLMVVCRVVGWFDGNAAGENVEEQHSFQLFEKTDFNASDLCKIGNGVLAVGVKLDGQEDAAREESAELRTSYLKTVDFRVKRFVFKALSMTMSAISVTPAGISPNRVNRRTNSVADISGIALQPNMV